MAFRSLSLWLAASALALASCGGGQGQGVCGDGILDGREECDDGNTTPGDGCAQDCTSEVAPACGDGILQAGEECDDGNNTPGDGCDENCASEGGANCGDGVLDNGEGCDDGNLNSGDGCSAGCTPEACGDGIVQAGLGEECDDGNLLPGDSCIPICENGPVEDTFLSSEVGSLFDTARYCDQMMTRHAVVRNLDLQDGGLRWRCGDVTGLDPSLYGQEYCEYSAVVGGAPVNNIAGVSDDETLTCLFTSVFFDVRSSGADLDAFENSLAAALAQPENLGFLINVQQNPQLVRMARSVNARGAADGLIAGCSQLNSSTQETQEFRQVACYRAFEAALEAGDTARANQLESLCSGEPVVGDPAAEARFQQAQQLGAQILSEGDSGFQDQQNIFGCVVTARGGGADFRNSDTNICARTFRAGRECGCDFSFLPNSEQTPGAPGALDGFLFAEWLTPENTRNPPECRLAKVNGEDYPHLMICDVPAQEIPAIRADPLYSTDLKGFCNDRFGKNLGIFAPLSAIRANCATDTEFCADFVN